MKLKLLVVALAIVGYTSTSQAQVDVTVNPIGLLFGDLSVGADFVLSDNFSVEGAVGIGTGTLGDFKWFNIPVTASGKYYFNPDDGADGFYANVFAKFIRRGNTWDGDVDLTYDGDYNQTRLGLGIGAGFKVVSNGGIVFDIGLGFGRALVSNISFNDESIDEELRNLPDWTRLMITGKLGLGYRFGG